MKIRVFDDDLYVLKFNERLHKNLQQVPHLLFSALRLPIKQIFIGNLRERG